MAAAIYARRSCSPCPPLAGVQAHRFIYVHMRMCTYAVRARARGGGATLTRARVLAHARTHALMRTYTQYWHTLAAVVQRAVRAHRARAQVRQRMTVAL